MELTDPTPRCTVCGKLLHGLRRDIERGPEYAPELYTPLMEQTYREEVAKGTFVALCSRECEQQMARGTK